MDSRSFYNEILTDHNLRPGHKHDLPDANRELQGVNPSCGDNITLKLRVKDGVIEDGAFVGDGCAISQASADMMLDLIIGKSEDEAKRLSDIFRRMIRGEVTGRELDELEEASALVDISHMPARGPWTPFWIRRSWRDSGRKFPAAFVRIPKQKVCLPLLRH